MLTATHQMGSPRSSRTGSASSTPAKSPPPPEQLFGKPTNERTRQFLSAVLEAG